jgi:hypothetical protein
MCCTTLPAILSSTILLAHQIEHEGKTVNVLGYQNHAKNKAYPVRPNAMIIPIPSAAPMGPDNCIDMTGAEKVFREYEECLRPKTRGWSKGVAVAAGPMNDLQVFESGSYTVLLTKDMNLTALREAMATLPEGKRLELDVAAAKVFSSFRKLYPDWHIAICIWEGEIEPEPLLWWYEPMAEFKDKHFLPGLDAHDGNPPDPSIKSVALDHTIVVGAPKLEERHYDNAMSAVEKAPPHLRKWLPTNVFGSLLHNKQARNGDWVFPKSGWDHNAAQRRFKAPRVAPPGYED